MRQPWEEKLPICMEVSVQTLKSDAELTELRIHGLKYLAVPPTFYDLDEATIKNRFQKLTALGFQIDTCHPPYGGGNLVNSLCAEKEDVREASIAMWQHYLRAFSTTGMRAVPLHTGGAMHKSAGEKALERLTDSIERILPDAKMSGVILALENTFYDNPCPFSDSKNPSGVKEMYINDDCKMLREYVERWNDKNVRVCHDVGHSRIYGNDMTADLETLAPLTVLYHIHDNDGVQDKHWNVGDGTLPWQQLVDTLLKNGFEYPLYDEVLGEFEPAFKPLNKLPERVAEHFAKARGVIQACVRRSGK